jgi:hypothetical protein
MWLVIDTLEAVRNIRQFENGRRPSPSQKDELSGQDQGNDDR